MIDPRQLRPSVATELLVFTVRDSVLRVLLVHRDHAPFMGCWALPGATLRAGIDSQDHGEDLDEAAHRALEEATGLARHTVFVEQLGAFGKSDRDPRYRVISVACFALVPAGRISAPRQGSGTSRWDSVRELPPLAFDHGDILNAGVDRLRQRLEVGTLAFELLPETFTMADVREVFEAVFGSTYDPANFRRRFKRLLDDGIVAPAPGRRQTRSKPAAVFRYCGPTP